MSPKFFTLPTTPLAHLRSIGIGTLILAGLTEAYWLLTVPVAINPTDDKFFLRIIMASHLHVRFGMKLTNKYSGTTPYFYSEMSSFLFCPSSYTFPGYHSLMFSLLFPTWYQVLLRRLLPLPRQSEEQYKHLTT